ncbi:MAG: InlB B-repeat-containing protein [Ruminococcus sp.]|nr:InlB B-repeat-containing protein [Ruminococcus sp.]
MKKLLKKLTATASVCLLATCGVSIPASSTDLLEVTIIFDYESDGATLDEKYDLHPITVSQGMAITIPEGLPKREGFYCSGWTNDDIHAYTEGDVFLAKSDENIVLKPIWGEDNNKEKHTVSYKVEINNEILDTSKSLPDRTYYEGQVVTVPLESFTMYRNDAAQLGWTDGVTEFSGLEKFIVHDHDVTLTPNWKNKYKITYTVGDVDRIVGMSFVEMEQPESLPTDIKANDTFSRKGFSISGWLCDADNQEYKARASYIMPSQDVTFTAIWTPKEYNVVFKQDGKSSNNLKVKGLTDTAITTPEPTITKDDKYFAGWKYEDKIYPANSSFVIPGAIAGAGIVLEAVWTDEMPTAPETIVFGDSDESGDVNINDAVLIMQSIANPDKYSISEQGQKNADLVDTGDGVTNSDALAIQYIESRTITSEDFPITSAQLDSLAE